MGLHLIHDDRCADRTEGRGKIVVDRLVWLLGQQTDGYIVYRTIEENDFSLHGIAV